MRKIESEKVFPLNNGNLRNLCVRLTSLSKPGPSVLCQQPGMKTDVGETDMGGKEAMRERQEKKRDRKSKHRTRLKFLGKKAT